MYLNYSLNGLLELNNGMLFGLISVGVFGEIMSSCEICGNLGSTKLCVYAGTKLQMCVNCMNKMGVHAVPSYLPGGKKNITSKKSNYSRTGSSNSNTMRQSEDLKQNFARLIIDARTKRGWNKQELAVNISEKVNVIKRIEQGIRPNDKVIKKIEKCLGIKLMEGHSHIGHTRISSSSTKGFTMGDFLERKR